MSFWSKLGAAKDLVQPTARPPAEPKLASAVPCLARILILSQDRTGTSSLSKVLRRSGYATSSAGFDLVGEKLARDEHPDIAIVDAGDAMEKALGVARALKSNPESAHVPVVLLARKLPSGLRARAVAEEIDDILVGPVNEKILAARLRPLVRLATMYNELRARAATARTFGVDVTSEVKPAVTGTVFAVVAVVENDADFGEIKDALGPAFNVSRTPDVFEAASRLRQGNFDALVVSIRDRADDALYLCGQIRNNPSLFNLPVLLVADNGTFGSAEEPYLGGASVVVPRPLDKEELSTSVCMLVRRQRQRHAIRDLLIGIYRGRIRDEIDGVYNRAFLTAHLERVSLAAQAWRKHLSIVTFQVQNLHWISRDHGRDAASDLLRQVAEWITTLVRVEDVVARNGPKEFCVILPETSREDAEVVANRLAGVLLNTQFGIKGIEQPIGAWIQAGVASIEAGDPTASLIERAHRSLK